MSSTLPIKVIGPCLALGTFATSLLVGLTIDNPADVILSRALVSMAAGYVVGSLIGVVVTRIVSDELARRAAAIASLAPADSGSGKKVITNTPTS